MPADAATDYDIAIDARLIERFIIEVDALATFDSRRSGGDETWLMQHIFRVLDEFEKATLGNLDDEESGKLHARGIKRGRELFREFAREMVGDDAR